MGKYEDFLASKRSVDPMTGLDKVGRMPKVFKPHQADITKWALRRGRAAIFAGTGLGKTLMELEWSKQVAKFTGKPVLILAPLAVSTQHVREGEKFGIAAKIVRRQGDVDSYISVTNYQKLEHFDLSQFGGICLDECFARDAPIDILDGDGAVCQKHIENIKIGDTILNASGADTVANIHRREVPYAVRVRYNEKSILASPNHPFFTQAGWKGAIDLRPGDQIVATNAAMRMVQEGICTEARSSGQNQILREILLSEMAHEPTGTSCKGSQSNRSSESRGREKSLVSERVAGCGEGVGEDRSAQPDGHSWHERKSLPHIEREKAQTFRAWGQWSPDDRGSGRFDGCDVRELDTGICFVTGPVEAGISHELQNRLSECRAQNSNRGGWSFPPIQEGTGCQEGCDADFIRVDGIEVLELGHPDLDQYRDADGKLYFYDLGATRHPSFSINGGLVHNSSILKNVDGHYRTKLIRDAASVPFRLAATATPAPNDFMELGNHAEFLGIMSYTDMLATFFIHDGGETSKWRLKGHAEDAFWKWMASWAVMLRKPSDLGYDDAGYDLPPLNEVQHTVGVPYAPNIDTGLLFSMEATGLSERIKARRGSIDGRLQKCFDIVLADWRAKLSACQKIPATIRNDTTKSIVSAGSPKRESINAEIQKKREYISRATTPPTNIDTNELQSNNQPSTQDGENDMLPTKNIERNVKDNPSRGTPNQNATLDLKNNLALELTNTPQCLHPKITDAPSAELHPTIKGDGDLPLIIATPREKLEAFCAANATLGSLSLKTIPNECLEPWLIWCNLNSEQDILEKFFGSRCYSVRGADTDDSKESAIEGWTTGVRPVMLSKTSILGFGLNFQFCSHTIFVGASDSFEQTYQAIRRFWRFGQTKPVNAHFIAAETEGAVVSNYRRKEADADRMASAMVRHMADLSSQNVRGQVRDKLDYQPTIKMQIPEWVGASL